MIRFDEYSSIRHDESYCYIQQDFRNPRFSGIAFLDQLNDAGISDVSGLVTSSYHKSGKQPGITSLESLFLLVTCQCNSNCTTCNFNTRINQGRDLTFSEIQKISLTAPQFRKLWISGGEPFLRKDLSEIIELFYVNNGIRQVHIWTNGILKDSIDVTVRRLTRDCPELHIYLNFSIDGIGQTHDEIRGIPGNFERTMCSIDTLEKSYPSNPMLHKNVTTVITSNSIGELKNLGNLLLERFNLNDHRFDIVRGNPRNKSIGRPGRKEIKAVHRNLMQYHEAMADKIFGGLPPVVKTVARAYYLGKKLFIYSLQQANMEKNSPWGMKCNAGRTAVVIEHDGSLKTCESRKPVGSLKDFDFDFSAAVDSDAMKNEINEIGYGKKACCWCTHPCWIDSSLSCNPVSRLISIPCHYFMYLVKKNFREKSDA